MTNLEKYEDQIKPYTYAYRNWAVKNSEIKDCLTIKCSDCLFEKGPGDCNKYRYKWLQEEYKEPGIDWTKVAVDTPILVSPDGEKWYNRYFAKYFDGLVWAWEDGRTSWTAMADYMTEWEYAKLAEKEE